nr:dsDNA nuclease domain-containing protein [Ramlibacter paludis]
MFRDFSGDETGGRHAIRGFTFQIWNAVLEALREHAKGGNYAVVMEWQQDVAILNSPTAPDKVRFIQLKKHETGVVWTLASLIQGEDAADSEAAANDDAVADPKVPAPADDAHDGKKKKPKKPTAPKQSILSKLYKQRTRFTDLAGCTLEFASEAQFRIEGDDAKVVTAPHVELDKLPGKELQRVKEALAKQLRLGDGETLDLSDFWLRTTDCPVNNGHLHVIGELAKMQFDDAMEPMEGSASFLAVLAIGSHVKILAGNKKMAKNLPELLERALTRKDVNKYLTAANQHTAPTSELLKTFISNLAAEGAPLDTRRQMSREVPRSCSDIKDRAGPAPLVTARLRSVYEQHGEYHAATSLVQLLQQWFDDFKTECPADASAYKREYLYCLMAMIYEDAAPTKHLPSLPPDSQPEDGQ